jgi:hypothetical protein
MTDDDLDEVEEVRPPVDVLRLDIDAHEVVDDAKALLATLRAHDLEHLTRAQARGAAVLVRRATLVLMSAGDVLDHHARRP